MAEPKARPNDVPALPGGLYYHVEHRDEQIYVAIRSKWVEDYSFVETWTSGTRDVADLLRSVFKHWWPDFDHPIEKVQDYA